jgi:uncharacterized membrane protein YqaE (UPF0057 family)
MKNLKVFSILAIAAVALASCGSGRFTSARYGNRDYVKVEPNEVVKTEQVKGEKEKAAKQVNKSETAASEETASVNAVSAPVTAENVSAPSTAAAPGKTSTGVSDQAEVEDAALPVVDANESEVINAPIQDNDATTGGDAELILLVILAIILPPLAVYLYDGSASTMFWITLILCILSGGFIFGFGGYLFGLWGLAILLAILHILEIL